MNNSLQPVFPSISAVHLPPVIMSLDSAGVVSLVRPGETRARTGRILMNFMT